ncbi:hypothetical protein ACINNAV72_A0034 [Acinetobacter baumannii Naval-72]|nr:hypothetical protein ACINNAV72_A0034 [Acinetobacter baumannii Naval-72]
MSVIEIQKNVCKKFNSKFVKPLENEMVAIALDSLGKMPITGIRNILEEGEISHGFSIVENFLKMIISLNQCIYLI